MTKNGKVKPQNKKMHTVAYVISVIVAIALAVISYLLYKTVIGMNIIPERYTNILMYALIGFNAFFALIAVIPGVSTLNKTLQIVICSFVAAALMVVNVKIPDYLGRFERMFNTVPEEGTLLMSVYALSDSEKIQSVQDLAEAKIGVLEDKNSEYLDYSYKVISRELNGDSIEPVSYDSVYSLAEDLYNGQLDAILMNQTYASFIADNADFSGFNYKTRIIYTIAHKIQLSYETEQVGNIINEPFIIAVSGNDSWDYSEMNPSTNISRSDVNMLVVVNPTTKKILIVSIPRDSYVAIGGDTSAMDKLTHSTIYGIDTWERTINNLLGIKINYFVRMNFQSLVNVVDALGGIEIDNPYFMQFGLDRFNRTTGQKEYMYFWFNEGRITINGDEALGYVRERKSLKNGDMDRIQHQAIVIKGLVDKVTQVSVITKISDLLKAIDGTFITDINTNQIFALVQMQLDDMASWDISSYSLNGSTAQRTSYAMGNTTQRTEEKTVIKEVTDYENPILDENGEPVLDADGNPTYGTKKVEETETITIEPTYYSVVILNNSSITEAQQKIREIMNP